MDTHVLEDPVLELLDRLALEVLPESPLILKVTARTKEEAVMSHRDKKSAHS